MEAGRIYYGYMDQQLEARLAALEEKIDKTFASAEKTRKYLMWGFYATVAAFVIPLLIAAVAVPSFLKSYTGQIDSITNLTQ